jgi:hypothetical protein
MNDHPSPKQRCLAYGVLAACALVMGAWSFEKWPDLLVDFGKEPYLAWQIAGGRTLYAELAYFNGPLSPYLNALWFRLFGVSLFTLWTCNFAIAALILATLLALFERAAGFVAAWMCGLAFVFFFAFGHYTPIGNYNYISPITHELTHGMLLSLLALWLVVRHAQRSRILPLAAAGLCLGLVFLTRAEVFVAAALGLGGALVGARASLRSLPLLLLTAALVPLGAYAWLCLSLPPAQALLGTLGTWPTLLRGEVASLPFYRWGLGLDRPLRSLQLLASWSFGYAAWLGLGWLAAARVRRGTRFEVLLIVAFGLLPLALVVCLPKLVLLRDVARPLPVVVLGVIAGAIRRVRAPPAPLTPQLRAAETARLGLSLFALGMLLKMILYVRLQQYGFAHAMPATLLAVAALIHGLPERSRSKPVMRAAGVGLLLAIGAGFLALDARRFAELEVAVGGGKDRIWSDARGHYVTRLLSVLADRAPAGASLAVYPEGAMLNFLSRRANPTPYPSLMPTELAAFGEANVLVALNQQPPDYVVLVQRDTSEFGVKFFGRDYARAIGAYLERHYTPIALVGARPFQSDRFGMLLLERNQRKTLVP